mgnify:CR=1 FL=1|tara:strand:- start:4424 stop:4645 length:222 start_codon:yes stop_codon:yes gene_type:complete
MKDIKEFKNTKLLIVLLGLLLVSLSGCGDMDGIKRGTYNKECIDGVVYYENMKRLAPAFNQDGTLKLCNKKAN